jgi:hypothetical protein
MNEIELKKLWDALQTKFDVGTFDEFKSKMATPEMRKKFYDAASSKFDLGSYDAYEKRLMLHGQQTTPPKQQPNPTVVTPNKTDVNNIDTYPPCVRFGKPTANSKGVVSISGMGKYKGMYFFNNGRYLDVDSKVKSYNCKQVKSEVGDDILYKLVLDPTSLSGSTSSTGTTTTAKAKSLYHNCNAFPFKKWCRNQKIKDIQKWIGFPVKYQTGNFGPITERGLKDLKIDISAGITIDIYNQIKKEHEVAKQPNVDEPQLYPNSNTLPPERAKMGDDWVR